MRVLRCCYPSTGWLLVLSCCFGSTAAFSLAPPSSPAVHRRSSTATTTATSPVKPLAAVSIIWDGPAWQQLRENEEESSVTGMARAVVGLTAEEDARVVALEVLGSDNKELPTATLQDGTVIYTDSIAKIPPTGGISDAQAAATLLQSIPVHTIWPRAEAVGGSTTSHHVEEPTAVVVGSSQSDTVAAMLAALGAHVTLVGSKDTTTTRNIQFLSNKNDTPFCDTIGKFDVLIDTLSDPSTRVRQRLASEHGCHSVLSTVSAAALTVQQHGLLQGPKRAKQEAEQQFHAPYQPTPGLGDLATRLLATGYTAKDTAAEQRQGWSWSGYWEATLWPTDTTGGMFGYPTSADLDEEDDVEDEYDDDEEDEDNTATGLVNRLLREQREQQQTEEEQQPQSTPAARPAGSLVTPITSRKDLQNHIVSTQETSVVLFTAPFCRTCRYLKPLYNRLAGQQQEHGDVNFYIIPDAATPEGKDLSRLLNVDAVPAVVMFRKGRRWGRTISLSSIPDTHLTQSLEWLRTDQEWDQEALEKLPRKKQRRR